MSPQEGPGHATSCGGGLLLQLALQRGNLRETFIEREREDEGERGREGREGGGGDTKRGGGKRDRGGEWMKKGGERGRETGEKVKLSPLKLV